MKKNKRKQTWFHERVFMEYAKATTRYERRVIWENVKSGVGSRSHCLENSIPKPSLFPQYHKTSFPSIVLFGIERQNLLTLIKNHAVRGKVMIRKRADRNTRMT